MNKICTSIEQSEKLIELGLNVNTADMLWTYDFVVNDINGLNVISDNFKPEEKDIPAWSLAALLGVLPEEVIENYYAPNLQKENGKYSIAYGNEELLCVADNPIDACYEMIIKLNELKML